jgi:signal transduction histidine kinase
VEALVSNFLLIAKPPKLEKIPQRLSALLDDLIKAELPNALTKGIRVERNYKSPALVAEVDAQKLYQVFLNIFLNAVQAMSGGGKLTIGLQAVMPDGSEEYGQHHSEGRRRITRRFHFRIPARALRTASSARFSIFIIRPKSRAPALACRLRNKSLKSTAAEFRLRAKSTKAQNSLFICLM